MATSDATSPSHAFAGRLGTAATDLVRALRPVLFAAWLAFVVIAGRPNLGAGVHDATRQLYVLLAALFVAYAAYLALARKLPDSTPLGWCALGLVGAYTVATLASVDARISAEASLQVGACVIAFFVFHERGFFSTNTLVRSLVFLAGLAGVLSLVQVAIAYSEWAAALDSIRGLRASDLAPPPVLRRRGVLDHPNNLAMLLNLALPFALLLAVRPRLSGDRAFGLAVALIAGAALLFTQSRGAWLGTIATQPVFWLLLYLHTGRRLTSTDLRDWAGNHTRLLAAIAMIGLALIAVALFYAIAIQPAWLFRATLGPRLETLRAAFDIFLDHPLTGAGPGAFGVLNEAYGIERPEALTIVHNAYLQVLADAGLFGALAVLAGGVVVATSMLRAWRRGRADQRALVAACTAALLATLVHGLLDSPPAWNTVLLPFALAVAIAMRVAPPAAPARFRPTAAPARLVVLALIPLVLAGWLAFDSSHSRYDDSLRALQSGRLDVAATLAVAAAQDDPDFAVYQLHAGVSLVALQLESAQQGERSDLLADGITYLQRAAVLDPHSSLAFANLAIALQLNGDQADAADAARRALAESPSDATIARVSGSVLEQAGLPEEAIAAYATAVRLDPGLSQSPFWASTPERKAIRPAVLAASGVDACALGRFAALYGVYNEDLDALAAECSAAVRSSPTAANRSSLALILFAQGAVEESRHHAEAAVAANPPSPEAMIAAALVLGAGDLSEVRTHLYRAAQFADLDAAALLAYTYQAPGTPAPGALQLLPIPQSPDAMPVRVRDQLSRVAPSGADTPAEAMQAYREGRMYYTHVALREGPATLLIPGAWPQLVSPALLLGLDAQSSQ